MLKTAELITLLHYIDLFSSLSTLVYSHVCVTRTANTLRRKLIFLHDICVTQSSPGKVIVYIRMLVYISTLISGIRRL